MPPRVTILTPCFNQAHFLPDAVRSVQAQTLADFEMLVIDDGSTDETAAIAAGFAADDARVKLIRQANQGQARARQAGLEQAAGEFLVLLDADDLLEPAMLAECVAFLEKNPSHDAVVANAYLVAPDGITILREFNQARSVAWPKILEINPYGALAAVMMRTASVLAAGGLNSEPGSEDWDLWVRMARSGMAFGALGKPLARYRQSAGSHSRNIVRGLAAALKMLDRCRKEDSRLSKTASPAAAPITSFEFARLVNGRAFHALGQAALGESSLDDVDAIMGCLSAGGLDQALCREQFLWGCHAALARRDAAQAFAGSPDQAAPGYPLSLPQRINSALSQLGYPEAPALSRSIEAILRNPMQKAPLLDRIRRRLNL